MSSANEGGGSDPESQARALALLEATHQFPCEYAVIVIALNRDGVTDAVRSAARSSTAGESLPPKEGEGPVAVAGSVEVVAAGVPDHDALVTYEARTSREGKYLSHRLGVRVNEAAEVLKLYARLRSVDGVVTIL